jgi:hypothetical protein
VVPISQSDPLSQELVDALRELTVPEQLAFARRQSGKTQGEMATSLGMKQGYYSRLEKSDKHLFRHYRRAAEVLGWRLTMYPKATRTIVAGIQSKRPNT